ncbi:hypothetical protein JOD24_002485 [Kroppenstedtia sanguinis]
MIILAAVVVLAGFLTLALQGEKGTLQKAIIAAINGTNPSQEGGSATSSGSDRSPPKANPSPAVEPVQQTPPKNHGDKSWADKAEEIPLVGWLVEKGRKPFNDTVGALYDEYLKDNSGGKIVKGVLEFFDPTPSLYKMTVGKEWDTGEEQGWYDRSVEAVLEYFVMKKSGKIGRGLEKLDKKALDGRVTGILGDKIGKPAKKKRDEFVRWACNEGRSKTSSWDPITVGHAYAAASDDPSFGCDLAQQVLGKPNKHNQKSDKKTNRANKLTKTDAEDRIVQEELNRLKDEGLELNQENLNKFTESLIQKRNMHPDQARNIATKIMKGNAFNKKMNKNYPHNEVILEYKGGKQVRVDSYVPGREIISRKYTQFNEIKPATAKGYINELARKYPPGAKIADVPTQRKGSGHQNDGLRNQEDITGDMILEVPVQKGKVPKEILDHATKKDIEIRDETGKVLNP